MLALGVFGDKYMTDCRAEFPAISFAKAKRQIRRWGNGRRRETGVGKPLARVAC